MVSSLSRIVRQVSPFDGLAYNFLPLTALSSSANVLPFVGQWEQEGLGGIDMPFIVTFTSNPDLVRHMEGASPVLYTNFSLTYRPETGSGTLILLLSMRIWLQFLLKTVLHDSRFVDIRKKLEDVPQSNDKQSLRKIVAQLNSVGSQMVELDANLSDFELVIEANTRALVDRKIRHTRHIPVAILGNIIAILQFDINATFFELIRNSIIKNFSDLKKLVERRVSEFEKFNTQASNMINLLYQEGAEKHATSIK